MTIFTEIYQHQKNKLCLNKLERTLFRKPMVAINTTTMTTIGSELSTWLWLNVGVLGQTRSSQAIGSFIGYCTCCILRFVCYEVSNAARINKPLTCLLWSWVSLLSVPGKVLTRILDSVRQKLLTHQRHEQSWFHTQEVYRRSHPDTTCVHRASA